MLQLFTRLYDKKRNNCDYGWRGREASQLTEWRNQNKCSCEVINAAQKQFPASESAVTLFAEREITTAFVFTSVHMNKQHLNKPYQEPPNPYLWHIMLRMFAHTAVRLVRAFFLIHFFIFSMWQFFPHSLIHMSVETFFSPPLSNSFRWRGGVVYLYLKYNSIHGPPIDT